MPIAWFNSAECQSPLVVVVAVVVAVVRVGCGGDRTPPRLVMRTARTDQLLVLAESVLTGVVTAAGEAENLGVGALLPLPQEEVRVLSLIPLNPSDPGIQNLYRSPDLILSLGCVVIVIHVFVVENTHSCILDQE